VVIGTLTVILYLHGTDSLKEKRSIVKRILARSRNQFNVAAAEVSDNDLVGRAQLAFVSVGNDQRFINSCMDKVLRFVDDLRLAEIADHRIDVINYS
jgi:uncharacterized protein